MPKYVEAYGQTIAFPDGMGDDAIAAAIKANAMGITPAAKAPSIAERFGQGLRDPINGGAQLLTKILPAGIVEGGNKLNNWLADKTGLVGRLPEGGVDQQVRDQEASYQQQRMAGGQSGIDWARMAGNVVNPANMAIASSLPVASSLMGRAGLGALGGAASAAISPVTSGDEFASEKAKKIGIGAVTGGVVPAIAAGIGRIVSPNASTNPALQLLKDEGVRPTIGQTLGGRWNSLEEKMQSVPIMGDAISLARKKALEDFNNAAINRATAPIGARVEGIGQTAITEAGDALSTAYKDAIGKVKFIRFDGQFQQDMAQLKDMAQNLTPPMRAKFNATVGDVLGGRTSTTGTMLGETVKKVDSELGNASALFGKSSVASEQELADALKQAQSLLRQQVARSNPVAGDAMRSADTGWANLVRVEGAGKSAKNAEGVFTPAQLNMAVQAADSSVRKRAVARGSALMQDLGNAGQQVLGNKVPNSGTAERLMYGGGAALGGYMATPLIPAGLLGGAAAYSPPMQSLLRGAVSYRGANPEQAQAIAELLKRSSPMLGPAGGLLGLQMMDQ